MDPAWLSNSTEELVAQLLSSHHKAFAGALLACERNNPSRRLACQELFACGFPVLAHGTEQDPKLMYANAAALHLWDKRWNEMVGMPSRLTAPEDQRRQRQIALGVAQNTDAVQNYSGIRINQKGRRFMIDQAKIWTLWDQQGHVFGQAASFNNWWWI
ncbi:MAG: MEKHLA domain-containing protein [Cyanobium sp. NAT70]|nr:MEKHLA domain-containing protein [Cyanobium sp. NAT70]|tara:strand:- start:422 stop:895 length:474 start_codon:yes stop_codon:yes gene_type:complete